MRALFVSQLKPGLTLGRPLLDGQGNTLLNRGIVLTDSYIGALRAKGYDMVYITDSQAPVEVEPEEDLSPETRARALSTLREAYDAIEKEIRGLRSRSIEAMVEACRSDAIKVLTGSRGPLSKIADVVGAIVEDVLNRSNLAGLATIRSADSRLHDHSINVCVVALMIGRVIGMPDRSLRQLAAGGLLHDLGMVFVEPDMAEPRRIRQHTLLGYELLRNSEGNDILAPHVALEHHEHQDGTGLPRGSRGSNALERDRSLPPPIPTLIGEIAAVANLYDNLLCGRDGKAPLPPDQVVLEIRRAAGTVLNRAVVEAFVRCVPVYPVGAEIVVRAGPYKSFTGVVSEIHLTQLDRPVIVLTRDNRGNSIEPVTVDMKEDGETLINCRGL